MSPFLRRFVQPPYGLALVALAIGGLFLFAAAGLYRVGFPLDDAWIYQAVARTFVHSGTWGIRPGEPAAGATAPLWVLLLTPAHVLPFPAGMIWAWLLGLGCLAALAALVYRDAAAGLPRMRAMALALLFLAEWHGVWAALSGMETIAFLLMLALTFHELRKDRPMWPRVGLYMAMGVWLRPEAVLWLVPWAWRVGWLPNARMRIRAAFGTLYPLAVGLLLYVAFQSVLTGTPLPNTAQAKVVEYGVLRDLYPYWLRLLRMPLPLLAGPALVLLPWVPVGLCRAGKPWVWGEALWMLAHTMVYAWRLPVTYQHGRYMMPVLVPWLWWGGLGFLQHPLVDLPATWAARWDRFRHTLLVALTLAFLSLGARAFAWDVAVIESEMVDTAHWVAQHLPQERLAAHDIGALAYFAPQPILDLAGLANPEVVSILRDEAALAAYLHKHRVRFLIAFADWYTTLTACAEPLYRSQAPFSPQLGGAHMTVYRWRPCTTVGP